MTVLTTAKRADQRAWPMPAAGVEVIEVPFRVPWILERLRCAHKEQEGGSEEADAAGGMMLRRLRTWRERRGVFCSVRMPDLTDYWVQGAVSRARELPRFDVVFSSAGPYTAHLAAMKIRRAGGAGRWVADFRDLWVDNHIYRGLFPFTLRERRLERVCLHEADLIVTVSEGLRRTLRAKTPRPVELVYNGYDPQPLEALAAERFFPADGLRRLVYTGSLYASRQDPSALMRGLHLLQDQRPERASRLRVEVAGTSGRAWRRCAAAHDVAEFLHDRGTVQREDALRMQRDADALLVIDYADPETGVLTAKLFEYLASGPPIVVIGSHPGSPIGRLVADAGRGHYVSDDRQEIAAFLQRFVVEGAVGDPRRDDTVIGEFTRERQAMRLYEQIEGLVTMQAG